HIAHNHQHCVVRTIVGIVEPLYARSRDRVRTGFGTAGRTSVRVLSSEHHVIEYAVGDRRAAISQLHQTREAARTQALELRRREGRPKHHVCHQRQAAVQCGSVAAQGDGTRIPASGSENAATNERRLLCNLQRVAALSSFIEQVGNHRRQPGLTVRVRLGTGTNGKHGGYQWQFMVLDHEHTKPVWQPTLHHRRHEKRCGVSELRWRRREVSSGRGWRDRPWVVRRRRSAAGARCQDQQTRREHHTSDRSRGKRCAAYCNSSRQWSAGRCHRKYGASVERPGYGACSHRAPPETISSDSPVGTTVSVTRGLPRYSRATRRMSPVVSLAYFAAACDA